MIDLTPKQKEVIAKDGLTVVSACPGSGKTCAVAHRLKRLIEVKSLSSYQGVAVLSFTNVAKDTVLSEFKDITHRHISAPHFVGTIDSFLNTFLFYPFGHKVLPGNPNELKIIDVHSSWLQDVYPKLKNYKLNGQNITYDKDGNVVYQKSKLSNREQQQYIDYVKRDMLAIKKIIVQSDVSFFCYKILREHSTVVKAIIERFPFIIIDEAQDCSDLQMAIIDFLIEMGHKEIMLVGDPYQAIYEWRDANPELFVEKENSPDWQNVPLLETQRSGPEICRFLNLFHECREISHNPRLAELLDAEVKINVCPGGINATISAYLADVQRKNISIDSDNVAILYGGHQSKANFRRTDVDPISFWKTQDNGISNVNKVFMLPLLAKILMVQKNYKRAYSSTEKFFYFLLEKKHLISSEKEKGHRLFEIDSRIIIWDFCKRIPSLATNLDDWINNTNVLIRNISEKLNIEDCLVLKKKARQQNCNLEQTLFVSRQGDLIISNITCENIHQIKGRTFQAVMVYIDSGRGNYKLSVNKLRAIMNHKDLFGGEYHEDGRCFYVASSRARRLLWIVSQDNRISNLFDNFN